MHVGERPIEESDGQATSRSTLTRSRLVEIGRILLVGAIAFLYWRGVVSLPVLLVASPSDFIRSSRRAYWTSFGSARSGPRSS